MVGGGLDGGREFFLGYAIIIPLGLDSRGMRDGVCYLSFCYGGCAALVLSVMLPLGWLSSSVCVMALTVLVLLFVSSWSV